MISSKEICFTLLPSSIGLVLVAKSEKGLCAALLGDKPAPLIASLKKRFPRAALIKGDKSTEQLAAKIVRLIENPKRAAKALQGVPLDVRGTAFQMRVWKSLQKIPCGQTVRYADVARTIGNAKACRAVANACGANALAVIIPCHRVIASDGSLGGYASGVKRKRLLLEREKR